MGVFKMVSDELSLCIKVTCHPQQLKEVVFVPPVISYNLCIIKMNPVIKVSH